LSNILALHQILHDTKRRSKTRIILKLVFEKAYDKVHWDFLMECMRMRGFHSTWCDWVERLLQNGTMVVKLNGIVGHIFKATRVRSSDLLSHLLFNIATDCLTRMVMRAQQNNLVSGPCKHLIPMSIVILQDADDTIICLKT
jgi:hypothetical protein